MRKENKNAHKHRSRHGNHQKRTHKFLKVYTPYLPLVIFVSLSLLLSIYPRPVLSRSQSTYNNPQSQVMAYATEMSIDGLLGSTNQKRTANGVASLSINAKLNNAAQAKANDMVTRDYWSHNTPDGSPPWVFITNAGYSYSMAGENLAYGQQTSSQVINDWFASPSHKDNLLNKSYKDVGFGVANSPNYTGDVKEKVRPVGQQTIIVAMYATPYTATPKTPAPTIKPAETKQSAPASQPAPITTEPKVDEANEEKQENDTSGAARITSNDNPSSPVTENPSVTVSKLESITSGSAPWLTSVIIILSVSGGLIVLGKHGYAFHNFVLKGERYVLQHTLFDVTIISMITFSYIATRSAGVIS